jgi:hypothetical protein
VVYAPRITRGALVFDLTAANGVTVSVRDDAEEWVEESAARLNRHGGVWERNLFAGGVQTVRGVIRAATLAAFRTAIGSLLNTVGSGGEDITFRVFDDREIRCRPVNRAKVWVAGDQYSGAEFEVQLKSLDPFWRAPSATGFSAAQVGNGETTASPTNAGDAPAPFTLDITPTSGSISATTIVIQRDSPTPIEKVRLGKVTINAGFGIRIDTETGAVTDLAGLLGLATALPEFVDGLAFLLMPGPNTLRFRVNGTGTPLVTFTGSFRNRFQVP